MAGFIRMPGLASKQSLEDSPNYMESQPEVVCPRNNNLTNLEPSGSTIHSDQAPVLCSMSLIA
jgi:hypothetical protein